VTDTGELLDLSVLAQVTPTQPDEDDSPRFAPEPDMLPPLGEETPPPSARRNVRTRTTPPTTAKPKVTKDTTGDEIPQTYRPGVLVKPLTELYTLAGTFVAPFNQPVGTALVQNAERCAIAWDNAAKADKQIRRFMMMLIQGSTWGQIGVAHAPIFLALAVTLFPEAATRIAVVPPTTAGDNVVNPVSRG
jgi:hypothetical protein